MANKGWNNDAGGGEHTSSTDRQSGRGTNCAAAEPFIHGSRIAHPSGGDSDPLGSSGDLFETPGQLSTSTP